MTHASGVRAAVLAWTGVVLVSIVLLGLTRYTTRDPDSRLYAGIAARLSQQPVDRWIAPEWWGLWGFDAPYYEHPVGIFLAPAALARLGFPADQAAYAVNVVYQAASLALIVLLARVFVDPSEARALAWMLQLLPIAFVFRIRANHEYAVLAGLLLAVYSTERARARPIWTLGMLAGLCVVLLVKGVFALIVPVTCAIWLVARARQAAGAPPAWRALAVVGLMPVVAALVAWGYDAEYLQATGRSFLAVYRSRQVPPDALAVTMSWWAVPYTTVWYLGRIVLVRVPVEPVRGPDRLARREERRRVAVAATRPRGAEPAPVSGLSGRVVRRGVEPAADRRVLAGRAEGRPVPVPRLLHPRRRGRRRGRPPVRLAAAAGRSPRPALGAGPVLPRALPCGAAHGRPAAGPDVLAVLISDGAEARRTAKAVRYPLNVRDNFQLR